MINNSHEIEWIYEELGVNLDTLGCVMAELTNPEVGLTEEWLYYANNKERFWIDGEVDMSHVTLLYGLLPGVKKEHVDTLLNGWQLADVYKKEIMVFDSPYPDEPYKCIVLGMESSSFYDAHKSLSMLPHVKTFREYTPHLTIAYVKEEFAEDAVKFIRNNINDYHPRLLKLNYGNEIK